MTALLEQLESGSLAEPTAPNELVQFLKSRESYRDGTNSVEFKETHISWVALTDRRAYKVKKSVRFPFLDYSTLERRREACRDESRLGSRLAPGVYLGYLPITRGPLGKLDFGGNGAVVDYCTVMKRLPAERMLDRLIELNAATENDMERLLGVLVPFYAHAARGHEIEQYATPTAIERQARENLATIAATDHGLPGPMFARVRASQFQFLKLSADVFTARIRTGRVCEGHGDLRAEHVCMTSPPVVFDCVEFSLPLRAADVASELAFLAMECDFLEAPELGAALIRGYRACTGDDLPEPLVSFYKSYRACIRAKVELLRAGQQAGPTATRSRTRARRYLQLASYYATEFYRPKMFVMVGAAGTGKSTLADGLADSLGLTVLRSDTVRRELARHCGPATEYGQDTYSDSMTSCTYEALFDRAATLLGESVSVVLDATFRAPVHRERAVRLAQRYGAQLHFVYCHCPPHVARARIAKRLASSDGVSDARPEMHDLQQAQLDSARDWESLPVITVDASKPPSVLIGLVIDAVAGRQTDDSE